MLEQILKDITFILQHDGELNLEAALAPQVIYEDDRIEIIGQLTGQDMQLAGVVISLHLSKRGEPSRMVENTQPFALPRHTTYETIVLQWTADGGVFMRPGLWTTYLEHLVRKIQGEINAFNLLNSVPVDDTALFGDIPLNKA